MRRWPIIGLSLLAACAAVAVLDPFDVLPGSELAEPGVDGSPERETATAIVQSLETTFEAESGEIVFAEELSVTDPQSGIIGWIIEPESTVQAGDVLYERDLQPVVLMSGDQPAWRTMTVGDVGQDVAQLESNLATLGYGAASEFTIDDTFTSVTATIVQRWQADLGVEETGTVAFGDVVFGPETARVGAVTANIGDAVGDLVGGAVAETVGGTSIGSTLLTLSTFDREIRFDVTAESIGSISPGSQVSARLPDRSTADGTVQAIAPAGSGASVITATMLSAENQTLPLGDSIPVTVSWTEVLADDAVTVPASAILRLDTGLYAVEIVDAEGDVGLATVEIGQSVGGRVEIISGLEPEAVIISP